MIYFLSGNDTKKKSAYIKKLGGDPSSVFLLGGNIEKDVLLSYAETMSLFEDSPKIVIEDFVKSGMKLSIEEFTTMKESKTIFVFLEDKLLAVDTNKFKKYATIEDMSLGVSKEKPKLNVFSIAESFSRKDKMGTWTLYKEAVSLGSSPEEISGILFWKIKTMIISGNKFFTKEELKQISSQLVSLYHLSHLGKCDFVIGLEQFILSSLDNKK